MLLKTMKLHRIEQLPSGFKSYTSAAFESYETEQIPNAIAEAWYWYGMVNYEGTGHILMRAEDGLWHHHDCGHCSCYGPTDHIALKAGEKLEALLARCTADLRREIEPLTAAILSVHNIKLTDAPNKGPSPER